MNKTSLLTAIKAIYLKINLLEDDAKEIIFFLTKEKNNLHSQKELGYSQLVEKLSLSETESWIVFMAICFELEPLLIYNIAKKFENYNKNYLSLRLISHFLPNKAALTPNLSIFQDNFVCIDKPSGFPFIDSSLRISDVILAFLFDEPFVIPKIDYLLNSIENTFLSPVVSIEKVYHDTLQKINFIFQHKLTEYYLILSSDLSLVKILLTLISEKINKKIVLIHINKLPDNFQELYSCLQLLRNYARLNEVIYCFNFINHHDSPENHDERLLSMIHSLVKGYYLLLSEKNNSSCFTSLKSIIIDSPPYLFYQELWSFFLKEHYFACKAIIPRVIDCFKLNVEQIAHIANKINNEYSFSVPPIEQLLWHFCREETLMCNHPFLVAMKTTHRWEQLVLPALQHQQLEQLIAQVENSALVYREWGLAEKENRGLGITALFHGSSGTGKTMAAEGVAERLNLDLYRIDLSQVVSKYIGETQKNLEAIFKTAEKSNAILLFDEADSLFAKRSETKDSRDRYSNMEVSYLLSRMESYYGLSLLTTNIKNNIDSAFLRRFRFVIEFYYPDQTQRKEIWKKSLHNRLNKEKIDLDTLSLIDFNGASIRNVTVNAAFLVAQEKSQQLTMSHMKQAIQQEFIKLERPLTEQIDHL